ncbi:cell division protein FtsZ, partial [Rhodovulum visakhapatnamense]|nr:cell division protein FtsZ [Rhodovulum visakhapatnamense]
ISAHVQAPAPAQRPAAAAVAREPLVQEPVEEPSLFSGFDPANAGSSVEDLVETARGGADLPPPAYQPAEEPEAESFVAPRPRSPGEPTPETLARLRAAVAKTPARQPVQATMTAGQPDDPRGDKGRFGIGSLINRMSGHVPEQPERSPHTYRQQPPLYSRGPAAYQEEEDLDPDQERIEIPAFLRRQAN